jgi:hypothetical protein
MAFEFYDRGNKAGPTHANISISRARMAKLQIDA